MLRVGRITALEGILDFARRFDRCILRRCRRELELFELPRLRRTTK